MVQLFSNGAVSNIHGISSGRGATDSMAIFRSGARSFSIIWYITVARTCVWCSRLRSEGGNKSCIYVLYVARVVKLERRHSTTTNAKATLAMRTSSRRAQRFTLGPREFRGCEVEKVCRGREYY
jgi:hypothetical protein